MAGLTPAAAMPLPNEFRAQRDAKGRRADTLSTDFRFAVQVLKWMRGHTRRQIV
jgi:hypothetical protein